MPQIWMTYDELGTLCDCTSGDAKLRAIHLSLDRKKSRDGATRVKLDLALMAKFFASVRESDFDLGSAIEALQATHRHMAELLTPNEFLSGRQAASATASRSSEGSAAGARDSRDGCLESGSIGIWNLRLRPGFQPARA